MKNQSFTWLTAILCALLLWSCSNETVAPKETASTPDLTSANGNNAVHPVVTGVCSDTSAFLLADMSNGGTQVNYCGPIPCTGNENNWGYVDAFATDTDLYFNIGLDFGWYVERVKVYAGDGSNITVVNGVPTLSDENLWTALDINPIVNKTQVSVPTASLGQCNNVMAGVTVVKLDFFTGADANSRTDLSIINPDWDNPNLPDQNTTSQFVLPWCNSCPSASQPVCDDVNYCDINFYCSNYEHIARVELGDIDHSSGNDGGYADNTNLSTTLEAGGNATITLTPGFGGSCSYTERWVVFIDWNRDGDFYDSGELVTWGKSRYPITRTFDVPANAETDCPIRMRVAMRWGCWPAGPCCSYYYGEAEDYNLVISGGSGNARMASRPDDNVLYTASINESEMPGDAEVVEVDGTEQFRSGSDQQVEVEVLDANNNIVHTAKVDAKTGLNELKIGLPAGIKGEVTYRVKGNAQHSATELDIESTMGSMK